VSLLSLLLKLSVLTLFTLSGMGVGTGVFVGEMEGKMVGCAEGKDDVGMDDVGMDDVGLAVGE
jgi:hypothetical protein